MSGLTSTPATDRPPGRLAAVLAAGGVRRLAVLGAAAVTLLACTGLLTTLIFQQYSGVKWAVTVAGPLIVLLLLLSRRPVTYLAAGAVVGLPFVPLAVRFQGVGVSPVLVLLAVGVVVGFLSTERGRPAPRSRLGWAGGIVALLLLPGAVRGLDAPWEWFTQVAMVAALAYVIGRACRLDPRGQEFLVAAVGAMAALQGLIAISEFQTGHRFNPYGGGVATYSKGYFFAFEGVFRPAGAFFDPISLGNVFALACPLLVALACHRGYPLLLRAWLAVASVIAAGALVLTLSRMSWIATACGVAVVLALSPRAARTRQLGFLSVAAVIVSVTAVSLAGPSLLLRFNSIFDPTAIGVSTADGDETRQQLWHAAFETFASHPVFGVGLGNLHEILVQRVGGAGLFGHAHSTYLQTLAESGILGGAALLLLGGVVVTEVARRVIPRRVADPFACACAGSIVALAVAWTTDYTVRYTAVLACMTLPFILLATRRPGLPLEPAAAPVRTDEPQAAVSVP